MIKETKYVIQRHQKGDDLHWDLMIESDGVLKTWRIQSPAEQLAGQTIEAEQIFDHQLRFLTYEGPVNKGAGSVRIDDSGSCRIKLWNDDCIEGRFAGSQLNAAFILSRISDSNWQLKCD